MAITHFIVGGKIMNHSNLSSFVRIYWDYYLDLEEQFLKTKRYVAFDVYNKNTYSAEFLKLMQAVCSEIDVVSKAVSAKLDPTFSVDRYTSIQKWGYVLQRQMSQILTAEVVFNHDIRVIPWSNWMYEQYRDKKGALRYRLKGNAKTPSWWTAYNSIKHERTTLTQSGHENTTKANLNNLIYCFAALYILETEYMKSLHGEQEPIDGIGHSKLFQPYYGQFQELIY